MMSNTEKHIEEDMEILRSEIAQRADEEKAQKEAGKKAAQEEKDKQDAKFAATVNEHYGGSYDKWAEAMAMKVSGIDDGTSAAQPSKSKAKAKAKTKPKPKPKPKDSQWQKDSAEVETITSATELDDSQVVRPKEKSIEISYRFEYQSEGVLHSGTRNSPGFSCPKSFIEANSTQAVNICELISISSSSSYIVTIDDLIQDVDIHHMLVTEPVLPVSGFFQVQAHDFDITGAGAKSRWWEHIAESFQCIFRDVIHGLIYLHSVGQICGDITNNIYVGAKGEGKILPLMDKSKSKAYDIFNLVKKMKDIVTLPFPETEVVDDAYQLPDELTHFLNFATKEKLKSIPFYWLVNHPYFWSDQERINFIMEFRILLKRDVVKSNALNRSLVNYANFCRDSSDTVVNWDKMIDKSVCEELFKKIYERSKDAEKQEGEDETEKINKRSNDVKEYDSTKPVEAIRYMCNSLNHANDLEYRGSRKSQVSYLQEEIESILRSFFPKIYMSVYAALYHIIDSNAHGTMKTEIWRAFEKWSSSYFASKLNKAVNVPTRSAGGLGTKSGIQKK